MGNLRDLVRELEHATGDPSLSSLSTRERFFSALVNRAQLRQVAEIGVLRGAFAECLLRYCPGIESYYMVDPWRHLPDWDKPANRDDGAFSAVYREAMARTAFAEDRRVVLPYTTADAAPRLPDSGLDLVYVDGDHSLRGITIDLINVLPKVREGGFIGGDDFVPRIFQHGTRYEPTLVFPFAVYFAEAHRFPIVALPGNQFLMQVVRSPEPGFSFFDLTGSYPCRALKGQFRTVSVAQQRVSYAARKFAQTVRRRLWRR